MNGCATICAILVFAGIGSFFGPVGFFIGLILGIIGAVSSAKEKSKESDIKNIDIVKPEVKPDIPSSEKTTPQPIKNANKYNEIVSEVIAATIVADGEVEESEIEMAILIIENDDLIIDKRATLDKLHFCIDEFLEIRNKSLAIYKLKITTIAHKLNQISDGLQKEMLLTILDNMFESIEKNDLSKTKILIEKFTYILSSKTKNPSKIAAIEKFILRSGDKRAIEEYENIKRSPGNFGDNLKKAAKGSSILRTALGVFTGVIAANLIMDSIHQYQLQQALANFDSQLEEMGGIDNLDISNEDISFTSYDSTVKDDIGYDQDFESEQQTPDHSIEDDQIDTNDDTVYGDEVEVADSDISGIDATEDLDTDIDSDFEGLFDFFG